MPPDDPAHRENVPFFLTNRPARPKYIPIETVAVCSYGLIPRDEEGGIEIRIHDPSDMLMNTMRGNGADNIFKVTDVGGGLCSTNGIDIFLGEQWPLQEDPTSRFWRDYVLPIIRINEVSVEWRDLRSLMDIEAGGG